MCNASAADADTHRHATMVFDAVVYFGISSNVKPFVSVECICPDDDDNDLNFTVVFSFMLTQDSRKELCQFHIEVVQQRTSFFKNPLKFLFNINSLSILEYSQTCLHWAPERCS